MLEEVQSLEDIDKNGQTPFGCKHPRIPACAQAVHPTRTSPDPSPNPPLGIIHINEQTVCKRSKAPAHMMPVTLPRLVHVRLASQRFDQSCIAMLPSQTIERGDVANS